MSCSLHDLAEYEASGLPAVLVASEEFAAAAQSQSGALGIEPAMVYVTHPIQSRNDEEMWELADEHIDRLISELLQS